jgi:sulfoxide reductase heme-binding subunit YedZ
MALVTISVGLGLVMAGKVMRRPGLSRKLLAVHEQTALAGLVAIAVHGITLLGDPWLHPGVGGIAVPFTMGFRPLWTGLGVVGGYLAAILGLSFYARRRIGARLWRKAHRATVLVYLLGLVHAFGAGSDASAPWFRWWALATTPVIGGLFVHRLIAGRARRARGARSPARRRGAPIPRSPVPEEA